LYFEDTIVVEFESSKKRHFEFIEKFKEMEFTAINNIEEESKER
jgi:hypothetical protein